MVAAKMHIVRFLGAKHTFHRGRAWHRGRAHAPPCSYVTWLETKRSWLINIWSKSVWSAIRNEAVAQQIGIGFCR